MSELTPSLPINFRCVVCESWLSVDDYNDSVFGILVDIHPCANCMAKIEEEIQDKILGNPNE